MRINFVGDIGLFQKFEKLNIDPFKEISLPDSDINISNFEFVIPQEKKKFFYDVQDKYSCSFNYLENLRIDKFHGLGIANNHSVDYGFEGAMDTLGFLKNKGIVVFGYSKEPGYTIGKFQQGEITLAIIACVKKGRWSKDKVGFGPDTYNVEEICKTIGELKKDNNHVVVYPHWGTELLEIPDFSDTQNAKIVIDAGASAVVGHHPHVSQGIEKYKNGIIAYSLGSFIFIPEEVLGHSEEKFNQEISICLNIEFSEQAIVNFLPVYYRYNKETKIPQEVKSEDLNEYPKYLNDNIYNQKLYHTLVRKELLKREIYSIWQRFKSNPVKTVFNYARFIKFKHVLKLLPLKK